MRKLAEIYPNFAIVQQVAAQIPWAHNMIILDKPNELSESLWYAKKTIEKKGFKVFHTPELQNKVDKLLTELKANNLSEQAKIFWKDIISYLEINGCTSAIIACTDISPCINFGIGNLLSVDSMDALARSTIEQYMRLQRHGVKALQLT